MQDNNDKPAGQNLLRLGENNGSFMTRFIFTPCMQMEEYNILNTSWTLRWTSSPVLQPVHTFIKQPLVQYSATPSVGSAANGVFSPNYAVTVPDFIDKSWGMSAEESRMWCGIDAGPPGNGATGISPGGGTKCGGPR